MEIRAAQPEAVLRLQVTGNLRGEWDADRLEQVVSNLVNNAIQHGNGTPITLTGQEQGNSVTLTVHNGGAPIPPEVLPYVFERSLAAARMVRHTTLGWACSLRGRSCRHTAGTFR